MRTSIFLIIITLCFTSACVNKKDSIRFIEKFPIETTLTGVVPVVEDTMLTITRMYLIKGKLVCYDIYCKTGTILKVYDPTDFKLLGSWGTKGRGPYEIQIPSYPIMNEKKNEIIIGDNATNKMFKINLDSVIANKKHLPPLLDASQKDFYGLAKFFISDSLILNVNYMTYSNAFDILDSKGDIRRSVEHKIIPNKGYPERGYNNLLAHTGCVNSAKQKVAIAYMSFDRLAIFNTKGDLLAECVGPDKLDPKIGFTAEGTYKYEWTEKLAYYNSYGSDNYISLTYSGIRTSDESPGGGRSLIYPSNIHIYDWDGNPKAKLALDHQVGSFVLDEENKQIIASIPANYEPFVVYDLSDVL